MPTKPNDTIETYSLMTIAFVIARNSPEFDDCPSDEALIKRLYDTREKFKRLKPTYDSKQPLRS